MTKQLSFLPKIDRAKNTRESRGDSGKCTYI